MKIYRTRMYRKHSGVERLWSERYCFSRRQFAALKQEMRWLVRMELDVAEIPDDAWQSDQVITREEA